VNLSALEALDIDGPITPEVLEQRGLIRGTEFPVKVLGHGELTRSIEVHAQAFSKSAKAAIEEKGGSVTELARTDRWMTARPRNRRLAIDRDLKAARLGKVGGIKDRSEIASS
jgi:hypothetical protein